MSIAQNKVMIEFRTREKYLESHFELSLDKEWARNRNNFPDKVKGKGIYIIFTKIPSNNNIIYIGKTRGPSMDFATRLYRHATESASSNSKVYKELKKEQATELPVFVSLLDIIDVKSHYGSSIEGLSESAMIDILEQALIHYLKPRLQDWQ